MHCRTSAHDLFQLGEEHVQQNNSFYRIIMVAFSILVYVDRVPYFKMLERDLWVTMVRRRVHVSDRTATEYCVSKLHLVQAALQVENTIQVATVKLWSHVEVEWQKLYILQ